ncbi:NADH:flavin oxidoreductase/NADH oxidase [Actinomyces wuliandei]|uniref:NADH:flavin oxidoreductase/NADH oxidase n=1 Tax=Actinomyces wuliandei TaxID=2057743 RepID=UPI00111917F9|nr:NADH:flavin oxidoreductase/NADH oxidase [Actinomyces wuliandei]
MRTSRLLSPLTMRDLTARNRLWLPPMCMYCVPGDDGAVTDWHVVHYASRAVGGFGTLIVEATAVAPEGRLSPNDLGLWEESQVEGHHRIVEAVHAAGALVGVQLGHGGRKAGTPPMRPREEGARTSTIEGWDLLAPSAVAYPEHAVPAELDEAGIDRLVEAFAAAARRAVEAGYDIVELHGAHGYLIHEFLSPLSNLRTDSYGGSPQARRRFLLRVVEAVRQAIGEEKVLDVRLSATDWADGGLTAQDTVELACQLAQAGVDVLHVSTGGNVPAQVPAGPGFQLPFAAQVREAVVGTRTQVVGVGLVETATQAEQALVTGQADAVAVGRAALRDPYLPLRWAADLGVKGWEEAPWPIQYWRGTWH